MIMKINIGETTILISQIENNKLRNTIVKEIQNIYPAIIEQGHRNIIIKNDKKV